MKWIIKAVVFRIIYMLGMFRIWQFLNRKKVIIIMLHGVVDDNYDADWLSFRTRISTTQLEKAMRILSKYYKFISMRKAVQMLSGEFPVENYCIALTFDDGYKNNIEKAFPILKKYNAPAMFFVCTDNVTHGAPFWYDRLDYAIQRAPAVGYEVKYNGKSIKIDKSSMVSAQANFSEILDMVKSDKRSHHEALSDADNIIGDLAADFAAVNMDAVVSSPLSRVMDWGDIREACRVGIDIGSHAVDHWRLDTLDKNIMHEQLAQSKKAIESMTGLVCEILAYPYGEYSEEVIQEALQCGYKAAVTTHVGGNAVGGNLMTLRRRSLPKTGDSIEILATVSGLSQLINDIKTMLSRHIHRQQNNG